MKTTRRCTFVASLDVTSREHFGTDARNSVQPHCGRARAVYLDRATGMAPLQRAVAAAEAAARSERT